MTKTHRVETIEEYNTDGKLIRKTVTEENEEWVEDQPHPCPADCPGGDRYRLVEELRQKYSQYPYTNPYQGGPSDHTPTVPEGCYYNTTTTTTLG